jgi:glutathione S-transferase
MTTTDPGLSIVLGNKAYSSWSLRPWLALKLIGVPFEEVVIPLDRPETRGLILAHSPAGQVPVLHHGDLVIWDSLAIIEYLAELFPESGLWPTERRIRARARSVAAEMHAGFAALRRAMPMDLKRRRPGEGRTAAVMADVARISALWRDCRAAAAGGAFLFGAPGAADCMYAPVVTRFATYDVDLDPVCRAYVEAVLAWPALAEWTGDAVAEPWTIGEP